MVSIALQGLMFVVGFGFPGHFPELRLVLPRWGEKPETPETQNPANLGEDPGEFRSPESET